MTNSFLKGLLCFIVVLVYTHETIADPPIYSTDMVDAMVESENTNLPVLVIFTADWCKYCHVLINDIEKNPQLVENTIVCYIDYDKERVLSKEYAVSSLPTAIFIEKKIETKRMVGYKGIVKLSQWLKLKQK